MKRDTIISGGQEYDATQTRSYRNGTRPTYDREFLRIARWGFEQCENNPNMTETELCDAFHRDMNLILDPEKR